MKFERFGKEIELDVRKFRVRCGVKPEKREKRQLRDFVMDKKSLKVKSPVYLIYRKVKKLGDIEYDLTLIRNGFMGREYIRTMGHSHPRRYGELYEVLYGRAAFLIQPKNMSKFVLVTARAGQGVMIPPKCGHQTANIGKTPLLIGNLVYSKFKPDYSEYKKRHGAAYYLVKGLKLVRNENYPRHPKVIRKRAKKKELDKLLLKTPRLVRMILNG